MGHLNQLKREYRDLVDRLGAGTIAFPEPGDEAARRGWQEILEIMYTSEDAALASRLPVLPATLDKISKRSGIPPAELKTRLDAMAEKGLVLDIAHPKTGQTHYLLAPPIVGFFEFSLMRAKDSIPKRRMAQALDAYVHGDEAFVTEAFGRDTQIGRALVHETTLGESPEILAYERAESLIRGAKTIAVSLCYCRHKAEHLGKACKAPMEACLSLDGGADFILRRKFGRKIETCEALGILRACRDNAMVQIADNVKKQAAWICNCCACCCGQLQAVNQYGLKAVTPSGFTPENDADRCAGCGRCARVCPAGAIAMVPVRKEGNPRNTLGPMIDHERCLGCGVCADECGKDALAMERASRPYVPENAVEKAVRQALERGRLADLIFDAGEGLGFKALNRVVRAICALPPVDRVLAGEQVRSRFIAQALKTTGF